MDISVAGPYYYGQVSCIDRQIAELEARRDAIIHGYCFTGYKSYMDLHHPVVEEKIKESK